MPAQRVSQTPSLPIVIVGGGAGGLELACKLGRRLGPQRVTLVDRQLFHVWKPSLHEVAAGTLVEVLAEYAAPPNGIYAVFPQRKHLPLRVRLWIDFLKHHYAQPDFWRG